MKTPYPEIRASLDAHLLEVLPGLCSGLRSGQCSGQCSGLGRELCSDQCPDSCPDFCPDLCPDLCPGLCPGLCPSLCPGQCSDQDQDPLPPFTLTDADVAWPNAAFTPDADRPYLKPWCLFADTRPVTLGPRGFERLSGVYQISVFDVAGTGLFRAERIAAALTDAFRGGTVLPGNGLAGTALAGTALPGNALPGTALADTGCDIRISTASAGTARIDDGRLHIPVSVAWTCYVQK